MTPEVDAEGHYVLAKHAVVTFCLEGFPQGRDGIVETRIEFFNHQNVCSVWGERISVKLDAWT